MYSINSLSIWGFLFAAMLPLHGDLLAQETFESLSLAELLEDAREETIDKQRALLDVRQAELNFSIYRAEQKPQISANANLPNYTKTFSEITQPNGNILFQPVTNNNSAVGLQLVQNIAPTGGAIFMTSGLQRFDNLESKEFIYNGNPIRIGIIQPLLAFNALKWDKKIEPVKLAEARKKFIADVEDINRNAVALFTDLLVVNQELEIALANEAGNETLYSHAEEKFRLGKISGRDLMRLKLELISARKDRQKAAQTLTIASSNVYQFLGKDYDGQLIRPELPLALDLEIIDAKMAMQKAQDNRFDWVTFVRQRMEVDRDLERAKKEGGLNVDLQASFGFVRSSKKISEIYTDPQQDQFARLQLNVPIVDWGRQRSRVALAKTQKEFTEKQIQQDQLFFETQIYQLVEQVNYLQEELVLSNEIQAVAKERFEISEKSFVLGAINTTELILAQQERDQATRAYILSIRDFWQAWFDLRQLTLYDFENGKDLTYNAQ